MSPGELRHSISWTDIAKRLFQAGLAFKPPLLAAAGASYGGHSEKGIAMKVSHSAVWEDTVRTLKASRPLFAAVAGVFLFLPAAIAGYLAPPPPADTLGEMLAHMADNSLSILLVNIVGFVGNLSILILALDERRPTVGAAIAAALALLPVYFLVSFLSGFMIGVGLMLLFLPGIYLIGRLSVTGPVLVSEPARNPIAVIRRSFALTKGQGWAIAALILLLFLGFYVLSLAVTFTLGSILLLIDRAADTGGIGAFLLLVLTTALTAAFNVVLMVLLASMYRRLAPSAATAADQG